MRAILQDFRYAWRMLAKQPAFTAIAVLTLAFGIGANTAIFSVVNAVLLRPLPYPHSEQLILLRERLTGPNGFESGSVSYPNYLDWRAEERSFTDLALVRTEGANLSATDTASPPERIRAGRVTANYLSILQVPPRLGRDFVAKDDQPGAAKVALISERLWRNHFGGLPLALGQRLNIDGVPREIIGVVPERVRFPHNADIFIPLADLRADHDFLSRGNHEGFSCVGRLKPNVTLEQARAEHDRRRPRQTFSRFKYQTTNFSETSARIFGRRIPPSPLSFARRSWLRLADRVCECCEFATGSRNCAAERTRRARGAWRKPFAIGAASPG